MYNNIHPLKGAKYFIDIENLYPVYRPIAEMCSVNQGFVDEITSEIILIAFTEMLSWIVNDNMASKEFEGRHISDGNVVILTDMLTEYTDVATCMDALSIIESNAGYIYDILMDAGKAYIIDILLYANGNHEIEFFNNNKNILVLTIDYGNTGRK